MSTEHSENESAPRNVIDSVEHFFGANWGEDHAEVTLPGGNVVNVRRITADEWHKAAKREGEDTIEANARLQIWVMIAGTIKPDGERMFTADDFERIKNDMPAGVPQMLSTKILNMSGLGAEARKAAEKN